MLLQVRDRLCTPHPQKPAQADMEEVALVDRLREEEGKMEIAGQLPF